MTTWLLAQEAGDATRRVLPEIDEVIFGTLAFVVFFLFMSKLVFPALRQSLSEREETIRGELERAERARVEAEEQRDEYRRRISEARQEADRIIREAQETAEELRRERVQRAEEEARQVLEKARADATGERERVFADLQRQVAALSMDAAQRVVQRELENPEAQRELVERFISQIGSSNGGGRG